MSQKFRMLSKQVGGVALEADDPRCGDAHCPSVFLNESGNLVVVGRQLSQKESQELEQSGAVKIYQHEQAIEVSIDLVKKAFNRL